MLDCDEKRRVAMERLESMSPDQLVGIAVDAGILGSDMRLTEPYRHEWSAPSGVDPLPWAARMAEADLRSFLRVDDP